MRSAADIPRRLIVAIGGNAIDAIGGDDSPEAQKAIAAQTAKAMLPLLLLDNQLVITHGNGPQVGKLLLANAIARERISPLSLDMLVAQTQGATAYILAQAFENALRSVGNPRHVVGLVTQVEVDPADPAFRDPSKPVGPFFPEAEAKALAAKLGVTVKEDAGRGWRYVVPSPKPQHICDISLAQTLMALRTVVIAGGGGGVPVVRDAHGGRHGVEAVIDKDLRRPPSPTCSGIRDMMILTAVPRVAISFGRARPAGAGQRPLSLVRPATSPRGISRRAAWDRRSRRRSASSRAAAARRSIASLDVAMPALLGETGTHILSDADYAAVEADRRFLSRARRDGSAAEAVVEDGGRPGTAASSNAPLPRARRAAPPACVSVTRAPAGCSANATSTHCAVASSRPGCQLKRSRRPGCQDSIVPSATGCRRGASPRCRRPRAAEAHALVSAPPTNARRAATSARRRTRK